MDLQGGELFIMGRKKGLSTPMQILVGLLLLGLVSGGIYGAYQYVGQGSGLDDGQTDENPEPVDQTPGEELPWDGIDIKVNLEATDLAGNTVTSGDYHIFESQPEAWGDDKAIQNAFNDAERSVAVEGDGVTTIQDSPGTYYVALERSGAYPEMVEVEIPGGDGRFGDVYDNPGDYNDNPKKVNLDSHDRYSLGSLSWDLGIDSNSTSETEVSDFVTYEVSEDTEYRMDYIVVQTGTANPTEDSDVDGTYDEGISESTISVEGAKNSGAVEETFFNPDMGIDMLGADDQAKVTVSGSDESYLVFDGSNKPTVEVGATALETGDGSDSATGDEKASDGENFWDINYFDSAGNSNSVGAVTG